MNKRAIIIVCSVLVVALATFGILYGAFMPKGQGGAKDIAVEVAFAGSEGQPERFQIKTEQEYLGGALRESGLAAGRETEFGMFITAVNGIAADEAKQEWWCITKGGEQVNTGVDDTPIADGDVFELILKSGY